MIKRKLWIVLMCVVVLAFTGCGGKNKVDKEVSGDVSENEYVTENESVLENETVTENEKVTEETQTTDKKKDNTTTNTETNKNNTTANKNESTSNKNETTTKPSTGNTDSNKKPSTGATTKPSNGNNNTTTKPSTGSTGNTQNNNNGTTTQPSAPVHEHKWVEVTEEVKHYYDWRTICGKCKADLTDMTSDDRILHVGMVCGGRYSVELVEVDYVTENVQTETVVVGHKCSCGATK